ARTTPKAAPEMRRMSATGSAERGMTLLETLVVLAILGFIGSLAVVAMERVLTTFALHAAEDQVSAQLAMARARAVRLGEPVAFSAYDDGRTYGASGGTLYQLPAELRLRMSDPGEVRFYPDGSSTGGNIVLNSARAGRALSVDPVTG